MLHGSIEWIGDAVGIFRESPDELIFQGQFWFMGAIPWTYVFYGEFDSGSERTLAACLRHASRTENMNSLLIVFLVAHG